MTTSGLTTTKIATGTLMTLWTTQTFKTALNGLAAGNPGMLKVANQRNINQKSMWLCESPYIYLRPNRDRRERQWGMSKNQKRRGERED
jgi:hypothetical protein